MAERMRVMSKLAHRVEHLLGEHLVPDGVSKRGRKDVWRQHQLGALGCPSGLELTGLARRPVFAGGGGTEAVPRRLARTGGNAMGRGGKGNWFDKIFPDYRGIQRGQPRPCEVEPNHTAAGARSAGDARHDDGHEEGLGAGGAQGNRAPPMPAGEEQKDADDTETEEVAAAPAAVSGRSRTSAGDEERQEQRKRKKGGRRSLPGRRQRRRRPEKRKRRRKEGQGKRRRSDGGQMDGKLREEKMKKT